MCAWHDSHRICSVAAAQSQAASLAGVPGDRQTAFLSVCNHGSSSGRDSEVESVWHLRLSANPQSVNSFFLSQIHQDDPDVVTRAQLLSGFIRAEF